MAATPMPDSPIPVPVPPTTVIGRLQTRLWNLWATRSIVVGAICGGTDLAIFSILLALGVPTALSAMGGTVIGCTMAFFGNRRFAFRDTTRLGGPMVRFIIVTLIQIAIHGQLVALLRDGWKIPAVPAKITSDLCVFTLAQLLVLRYIVFPRPKTVTSSPSTP